MEPLGGRGNLKAKDLNGRKTTRGGASGNNSMRAIPKGLYRRDGLARGETREGAFERVTKIESGIISAGILQFHDKVRATRPTVEDEGIGREVEKGSGPRFGKGIKGNNFVTVNIANFRRDKARVG